MQTATAAQRDRFDMKFFSHNRLSLRFALLITLSVATSSVVLVLYGEKILENAMLEQTKKQAVAFLLTLEEELQREAAADHSTVQRLVDHARPHLHEVYDFTVYRIYALAPDGSYLAHSQPGDARAPRDMSGYLGEVLRPGRPYLGGKMEWKKVAGTDREIPVFDIVIPLHHGGTLIGVLEVEIDIDRTLESIHNLINRFEREVIIVSGAVFALMLAFLLWIVQRGLIRPIGQLADVTRRVAEGELSARASLNSEDELGQLGASINHLTESIEHLLSEQERASIQSMQALAKALEAKDAYTATHSARVSRYSVLLGRRIGLAEQELTLLKQGALMHDLGKIGIPDAILNKPGALDDREYEVMKQHPEATYTIMRPLTRFKGFAEIARWHHERWDGNGYPDGLKGESIPLLARIVAIADTWDAMTGDRVYRKAMPVEKALSILDRERDGGQWDPVLIGSFIDMLREQEEARDEIVEDLFAGEKDGG